jgi:hypothetical protein
LVLVVLQKIISKIVTLELGSQNFTPWQKRVKEILTLKTLSIVVSSKHLATIVPEPISRFSFFVVKKVMV